MINRSVFRRPSRRVLLRPYRIIRNGQFLGELDAPSPVSALTTVTPDGPRSMIRRIADIGAVMEYQGQHYQAVEA